MKIKIGLILIILAGFLIRIWRVGSYPPLSWDEASLGYNAYSILKTGRDEYGKTLPLIFKSFDDYKPGFYVYLTIPFVAVLGLNELAVRLPAVIFGSLIPLALYLLVKEISKKKKLALFAAAVLAFLPWHIHFSRGAWEVDVMTFFLVLGSWLIFIRRRVLGLIFFLLALLTYQGAKMIMPLILIGIIIVTTKSKILNLKPQSVNRWTIFRRFKILVLKIWNLPRPPAMPRKLGLHGGFRTWYLVFGALFTVWYWQSFSGPAKNRLRAMSLFSYHYPSQEISMILKEDNSTVKNFHFYLFHSQELFYFRGFLTRYFNYFSPRFLAFSGDWSNPRYSAPYFGAIGHLNFLLFFFGLFYFLSRKRQWKEYFFLYWLAIAPLPAALTRNIICGVCALPMVVPLSFFIAYGIYFFTNLKSGTIKRILVSGLLVFLLLDLIYWADLYFVHMVKRRPKDWLYGYKQTIKFVQDRKNSFKKVIFTDFYGRPYIYYLFYTRYPPQKYQKEACLTENLLGDVGRVEKLDNIFFKSVDRGETDNCSRCLFVFSWDEIIRSEIDKDPQFFSRFKPLGTINNQVNFYDYENKK